MLHKTQAKSSDALFRSKARDVIAYASRKMLKRMRQEDHEFKTSLNYTLGWEYSAVGRLLVYHA